MKQAIIFILILWTLLSLAFSKARYAVQLLRINFFLEFQWAQKPLGAAPAVIICSWLSVILPTEVSPLTLYAQLRSLQLRSDVLISKMPLFPSWDCIHGKHFWGVSCLEVCWFRTALVSLINLRSKFSFFKDADPVMFVTKQKEIVLPHWQCLTSWKKKKIIQEVLGVARLMGMEEVKPVMENSDGLQW